MLRQRNSLRKRCSSLVPMYGISSQSVGLGSFDSVVLLSLSFAVFRLKRFMSEKTTCLGHPFHDPILLRNCNSWASFVGEQILLMRPRRERIHAMRCFHGTKQSK